MRGWMVVAALCAGCGGKDDDVEETGTTAGTDETTEDPETDTYVTPEPTYPTNIPDAPTGIDEDCWAWVVSDSDDDGAGDDLYLRFHDPVSLGFTHEESDYGGNGVLDVIEDRTLDAAGNWLTWVYDGDGYDAPDGDPDSEYERAYDADGNRTRHAEDLDGDGAWDTVWTYVVVDGKRQETHVDEGDDGVVDVIYTYTYDDQQRTSLVVGLRGADPEETWTYTYLNPTGLDVTITVDEGSDGYVEETYVYTYDANDRIVTYSYDDGVDPFNYAYTYTADGDVATIVGEIYSGDDLYYSFSYDYSYLAPKMESERYIQYDFYGDGSPDFVIRDYTTWTCPQ